MPPRYMATVTCPSCGTRFQTPVEQILDVRADAGAKNRVLGGAVNVAICPACGTGGALNIPFIYHDPDKEVALLYLPVEAGPNEVERQRSAGRLARQLMDAMPPEERKGYLLQPETFIAMDTLVKRVLELEGITEEDMAHSQRQREFIAELIEAEQSAWPEMVAENADLVDEGLLSFLEYLLQMTRSAGQQGADTEKVVALHEYFIQETEVGRELAARSEIYRAFAEDPSRASLLDALIRAPDEETIRLLVQSGLALMDYGFFQSLVKRIDQTESPEEKASLQKLRRTILDLRDEMMKESEEAIRERGILLSKLVSTEDPVRMATSHLSELDDLFFTVLGAEMRETQQHGDEDTLKDLERVANAVNQVMENTMPPEIAATRQLMAIPEDQLEQQLQAHRELLTPPYLQFLEALEGSMREQGQDDAAEHIGRIRAVARKVAPQSEAPARPEETAETPEAQKPAAEGPSADSEERTPSGLIIAKR